MSHLTTRYIQVQNWTVNNVNRCLCCYLRQSSSDYGFSDERAIKPL